MPEPKISDADVASASSATLDPAHPPATDIVALIERTLDDGKAEDIVVVDLVGKSSFADYMLIASGRSSRQVAALADQVVVALKEAGQPNPPVEGKTHGDWVLIDAGDVIVHLFRPEVRLYYNLERMWCPPVNPDLTPESV